MKERAKLKNLLARGPAMRQLVASEIDDDVKTYRRRPPHADRAGRARRADRGGRGRAGDGHHLQEALGRARARGTASTWPASPSRKATGCWRHSSAAPPIIASSSAAMAGYAASRSRSCPADAGDGVPLATLIEVAGGCAHRPCVLRRCGAAGVAGDVSGLRFHLHASATWWAATRPASSSSRWKCERY